MYDVETPNLAETPNLGVSTSFHGTSFYYDYTLSIIFICGCDRVITGLGVTGICSASFYDFFYIERDVGVVGFVDLCVVMATGRGLGWSRIVFVDRIFGMGGVVFAVESGCRTRFSDVVDVGVGCFVGFVVARYPCCISQ
jgi:hypothetical protein